MKKLFGITVPRSDVLLMAATIVAALRLMLINSVFINFNLKQWWWFAPAEVWSGVAFAVLEGLALAYVSERWRKLNPKTTTEWVYWGILLAGMVVLLAAIVWVTAWAAMATRRGVTIDELLNDGAALAWSMLVAAINPIIAIMIGIVKYQDGEDVRGDGQGLNDYPKHESRPFAHLVRKAQAGGLLDRWEQENGKATPTVAWLIEEFGRVIGERLPANEADEAIVEWRKRNGIAGRRPAEREGGGSRELGIEEAGEGDIDRSNGKVRAK